MKEAAWTLAFLTTREDEYIRLLLDMGIVEQLVRLLARLCQVGQCFHHGCSRGGGMTCCSVGDRDRGCRSEVGCGGMWQGGGDQAVALPVLRALANIIGGPDPTWTEWVVQQPEIVPTFLHLLSTPMENRALVKEVGRAHDGGPHHQEPPRAFTKHRL